ncbi:hypothetical protein P175DRAFT_0558624 [Aspergillus ochraceoroseus IBT 24754]|uniref:Uncharacterized protein n=3 Tax=Aspergillus subgen. Nidulantes TaxID=2720870 RepID=A0A0F8UL38_9EURO|nr:uncharacterized protein P175DRAFT_0558624 [Aspergillus ochraceoroseus IBT 24754]KKK20309.1 hypothetical protein ARAM_002433 [Aspergillus rambellii]KKK24831.1 hypothetical protein AOCH_000268 [Aspergillus ochraceoroseus]PTU20447.1 hypothetical protein P175DRAFT_0558624 [Aspergillus ochraceoroseus IBT 24754]
MAQARRKWAPEEDARLRELVQTAIEQSSPILWCEIAKGIPGRSNKDCRRRWHNSLARGLSKGFWTESEDERLWNAVRKHGKKWAQVAQEVRTRNSDQCSSHWSQTLNPDIDFSDWTWQEDETLLQATERLGTNWAMIAAKHLPTRTTLALRNRYNALRKKISNNNRQSSCNPKGRHLTASLSRQKGQRRSSVAVKGGMEDDEDDGNYAQIDLDDSDDLKTSDEDHFSSVTGSNADLMELQDLSSPSLALPEYAQYPVYQASKLSSTPEFTVPFDTDLDLGNYDHHTSLDTMLATLHPPAAAAAAASSFTIPDRENFMNVAHAYPPSDLSAIYPPGQIMPAHNAGIRPLDNQPQVARKDTNPVALLSSLESLPPCDPACQPLTALEPSEIPSQPLQHASINVVCTSQQLSHIMGAVVGIANSVTLKLEHRTIRNEALDQ